MSVPILEAGAQVATLTVGSRFDVTRFGVPAVLLRKGVVIAAQSRDLAPAQIEKALANCTPAAECEVNIQDQAYLSLPLGLAAGARGRRLHVAQLAKCRGRQRSDSGRFAQAVSDRGAYRARRHARDQCAFFALDRAAADNSCRAFAAQRRHGANSLNFRGAAATFRRFRI